MTSRILPWAGALTLLACVAGAEERTVALRDMTVVDDGRGSSRVLFRLAALPFTDRMLVERAVLSIPFGASSDPKAMEVRLCPVTASWSSGATWGAEHDAELYSVVEIESRETGGVAVFDMTVPLKALLEDGEYADGFILVARSASGGLRGADLERFDLTQAQLRVSTTALPSGLPPRARRTAGLAAASPG